jgi:hypothetical protein
MDQVVISVERDAEALSALVQLQPGGAQWNVPLPALDTSASPYLRWLLEDYPRLKPGASRHNEAILAQALLKAGGAVLFDALFGAHGERLAAAGAELADLDIGIVDAEGLTRDWPWELINQDGAMVAHEARSLVRLAQAAGTSSVAASPQLNAPLRILMVVARPDGVMDAPFRSVASRAMSAAQGSTIDIEVLRPPTFDALQARLFKGIESGTPFQVVHFDGHGLLMPYYGRQLGTLVFELPGGGADYVRGAKIAQLIADTGVRLLLLNACQSAEAPRVAAEPAASPHAGPTAAASLAEEVATLAQVDVVAMSHVVQVKTAAHIVGDIYSALADGATISDAVGFARRRWRDGQVARSAESGHAIIRHFAPRLATSAAPARRDYAALIEHQNGTFADPRLADIFKAATIIVGSDDAILTVEQRLRQFGTVALVGLRGAGKTTFLLEFGRWLCASKWAEADNIRYVDLALEPLPSPNDAAGLQVLLVDNARLLHGDPLRGLETPPETERIAFAAELAALRAAGVDVVLTGCSDIPGVEDAARVAIPPLELEDLRDLVELRTEGAVDVPDPALLWTGGNPGALDFMIDWARAGHLADADQCLAVLCDLGMGTFSHAPLPIKPESPVGLSEPMRIFDGTSVMPWVVSHFQSRLALIPSLTDKLLASYLKAPGDGPSFGDQLVPVIRLLEQAGLVCRSTKEAAYVHPLLATLVPTPLNFKALAQQGYRSNFVACTGFYTSLVRIMTMEGPAPWTTAGSGTPAFLPNLVYGWHCSAWIIRDYNMHLSYARELRNRLLEAGLEAFWDAAYRRMKGLFEAHPPGADEWAATMDWVSLATLEARRQGDHDEELVLARLARQLTQRQQEPGDGVEAQESMPMLDQSKTRAYDARMKLAAAASDPAERKLAIEEALEIAVGDPLRTANAQLQLARLLRTDRSVRDLAEALRLAKAAHQTFTDLRAIVEPFRIVETALTASLVYLDLWDGKDPDDPLAVAGEALNRESLKLATEPLHRANAGYNLGLWRLRRGDPAEAEQLLLEAATEYESFGNSQALVNRALYYRLRALAQLDRPLETRVLSVRLVPLLLEDPDAPDSWKLDAFELGGGKLG